jgi:hypothetical protein
VWDETIPRWPKLLASNLGALPRYLANGLFNSGAFLSARVGTRLTKYLSNMIFGYGYSMTDVLTSETYPSQRTVSYVLDAADRVSSVGGASSGGTYASFSYKAAGVIDTMTSGNVTQKFGRNDRIQPVGLDCDRSRIEFAAEFGVVSLCRRQYENLLIGQQWESAVGSDLFRSLSPARR